MYPERIAKHSSQALELTWPWCSGGSSTIAVLGVPAVLVVLLVLLVLPIVSIVVPFFGLTIFIVKIPQGNPKQELQWRL